MGAYMRAILCNSCAKRLNNTSINVEQIITGHTRFPWHTSWNNDNISSLQSLPQLFFSCITQNLQVHEKNNGQGTARTRDQTLRSFSLWIAGEASGIKSITLFGLLCKGLHHQDKSKRSFGRSIFFKINPQLNSALVVQCLVFTFTLSIHNININYVVLPNSVMYNITSIRNRCIRAHKSEKNNILFDHLFS